MPRLTELFARAPLANPLEEPRADGLAGDDKRCPAVEHVAPEQRREDDQDSPFEPEAPQEPVARSALATRDVRQPTGAAGRCFHGRNDSIRAGLDRLSRIRHGERGHAAERSVDAAGASCAADDAVAPQGVGSSSLHLGRMMAQWVFA